MPISDGTFGMAFSPDGRTVAVIDPSLEVWDVANRAHPKLAGLLRTVMTPSAGQTPRSPRQARPGHRRRGRDVWNVADPARLAQIAVLPAFPAE